MALRLTTAPTSEPLTLVEAKAHLRITHTDDDDYIDALIIAAREAAEHVTQRSLLPQTWTLTLDCFPGCDGVIRLSRPPVTAVTWVKYYDTTNAQTTLSSSAYTTDFQTEPGRIVPAYGYTWPQTYDRINAVEVKYAAGYANAAAVPQQIKQWMLMRIASMYENRESEAVVGFNISLIKPDFTDRLLDRFCVEVF